MATIRARVKSGMLKPLKPLPKRLKEGDEVQLTLELARDDVDHALECLRRLDRRAKKLTDMEDWKRYDEAIAEHDRQAKEWMRREMGLDK